MRPSLSLQTALLVAITAAAAVSPLAGASDQAPPPAVSWTPERPVQGTLFVVQIEGSADGANPTGRFAGEPLHFREGANDRWALAAVPVDAGTMLELTLEITRADGTADTIRRAVPIAPGRYAMEHLTVAPQYGAPLSPALARRTADEAARAYAVARGAHDRPALADPADFVRPRPTRITSGFGNGREFNGRVESRHTGTDFQGGVGDPVVAAAPGVVRLVDSFYLGGNVVYIDHGGGLSSGYLHLSETRVAVGDTVQAGQRIGSVGATGRVTGPHLHWILRYGEVTVDPQSVFDLATPTP